MMSCVLKVGFGRNHYVFLILNDELIEKLATIKRKTEILFQKNVRYFFYFFALFLL